MTTSLRPTTDIPSATPPRSAARTAAIVPAVILLLALAVRVGVVLVTDLPLSDDPADYHRLAASVAAGDGFGATQLAAGGGPTAFRSPLYPFVLGLVYDVFGVSVTAARLVQAATGTLTVALIGLLALRLFGRRVGVMALAVAAVYPPLVLAGSSLITESFALPLLLGAVLLALEHRRRGGIGWAVAAGVVVGLAALTRENYLVLLLPLALLVWDAGARWSRRALAAPALLVCAAVAVVAPWTIRNAVEMDGFIPVSTVDGFIWAGVYNEVADSDTARFPAAWLPPSAVPSLRSLFDDPSLDEDGLSRELRHRAVDYIEEHPAYVAEVVVRNTIRLLDLSGRDHAHVVGDSLGYSHRVTDLGLVGWYLAAPLALVGLFLAPLRRTPWQVWTIPVLFVAVTVVALGTYRYRAPLEPFVVVLASYTICSLRERRRDVVD